MVDPLRGSPVGPYGPGPADHGTPGEFAPKEPSKPGHSFIDMLKSSVNEVNSMQLGAAGKVQKLVTGEISSLHEVCGVDVPKEIEKERGRLVDLMSDMQQYFHRKRVALVGPSYHYLFRFGLRET